MSALPAYKLYNRPAKTRSTGKQDYGKRERFTGLNFAFFAVFKSTVKVFREYLFILIIKLIYNY